MIASSWKIITSRQEHLSPSAQLVSKLCLSYIIFHFLRRYIFPEGSVIPAVILVLMVTSAFSKTLGKMSPRASSSHASSAASSSSSSSHSSSSSSSSLYSSSTVYPSVSSISSLLFSPSNPFLASPSSERQSLLNAVAGLEAYKERTMSLIRRRYALFSKMSFHHRQLASDVGYLERLNALESKVLVNEKVLSAMSKFAKEFYNIRASELRLAKPTSNIQIVELLHHFVRDWSPDLVEQRSELFRPILQALDTEFPIDDNSLHSISSNTTANSANFSSSTLLNQTSNNYSPGLSSQSSRSCKRVLVPGSGLARIAFEISCMGFQTEAFEYSNLMDIAANFMFNFQTSLESEHFEICPYIHDFSHQVRGVDQVRSVTIPDSVSISESVLTTNSHKVDLSQSHEIDVYQGKISSLNNRFNDNNEKNTINESKNIITRQSDYGVLRLPNTLKLGFGDFTSLVSQQQEYQKCILENNNNNTNTNNQHHSSLQSEGRKTFPKTHYLHNNRSNTNNNNNTTDSKPDEIMADYVNENNNNNTNNSNNNNNNVYTSTGAGQYDAVVTLFLIDTAENAFKYLEAIHALLKPGGIWINYGPLKWGTSPQVEFTLEELHLVIAKLGFVIESKFSGTNEYNGDQQSMWQGLYKIQGWVARKPVS